ncbi:MAG TPA: hypothetical protein VFU06_10415 [Longimicrobiales bacterium]|nr:hypothetical protein [Longimicrobiales bacterium]
MSTDLFAHRNLSCSRARATSLLVLGLAACAGGAPECQVVASARLPAALREASGVAVDGAGRTWAHADSGEPLLFQVDDDGRIVQELRVPGVRVQDWEDLAIGACPAGECFYIGDIGDNLHERAHGVILRVPVPPDGVEGASAIERFRIRYPDGPSDAEALAVTGDGSVLVVTKGRNRAVSVYRYPAPLSPDSVRTLEHVQNLTEGLVQVPQQITGGSASGQRVVLRSYSALHVYEWTGDSLAVAGPPIDIRFLAEQQGEGVALDADGTTIVVGEGQGSGTLARLRCDGP